MLNLINFIYRNIVGETDEHHTTNDKLMYVQQSHWIASQLVSIDEFDVEEFNRRLDDEDTRNHFQRYMDEYSDSMMGGGPSEELERLMMTINDDHQKIMNVIFKTVDEWDE